MAARTPGRSERAGLGWRGRKSRSPKGAGTGRGRFTPPASKRYTPPIPREKKVSPRWVPVTLLILLIGGALVIVVNYLGLLPGGTQNWYLLLGLGLITLGFILATTYR